MNMEQLREDLESIQLPNIDITQRVLQHIRTHKQRNKRNQRITAAVIILVFTAVTLQFQQITAVAESFYRTIRISLNNDVLIINSLSTIPFEVEGLVWVGSKREGNRVGTKYYSSIMDAEDELNIRILRNALSADMNRLNRIPFIYFEANKNADLLFHSHFVGDLKDYTETIYENGDIRTSYKADNETVYQFPLSMKISFFTGGGENIDNDNWEFFNYKEQYVSPLNGITAYFMKHDGIIALGEVKSSLRLAAGEIDFAAVFVHDNLIYTISGNVPSDEMKRIIDAFIPSD